MFQSLYPILGEPSKSGPLTTTPISYWPTMPKSFLLSSLFNHPHSTPFWPIASSMAYASLFVASTLFTEYVTSGKYASYSFYQERVGMFSPFTTIYNGIRLSISGRKETVDSAIWKREKKE